MIRVDTVGDLFDVALLLTSQPLPHGRASPLSAIPPPSAVLVTNACAAEGLSLARLEDVGVDGTPEEFEQSLLRALADD